MQARPRQILASAAVLLLCGMLLAACATLRPPKTPPRTERGLEFSHSIHMNAKMECADCHDFSSQRPLELNHQLCSVCHVSAAPLAPAPGTPEHQGAEAQDCALCHLTPDYVVQDKTKRFLDEIIWDHKPHIANEVGCNECHGDPDTKPLPSHMLMPDCMACHGKVDAKLNECSTCHKELDTNVVPLFHGTRRIQHDAPAIWEKTHGREALADAAYCAICHTDPGYCADCHRVTKPQSHTITFERQTHGMEAMWNRQSCSTCHEEDSCMQCHENTKPRSHVGGFGSPLNTHCTGCHVPRGDNSCMVCHQSIEHEKAMPSIHKLGLYPPNCALCHPGGVPTRAPHILNSTMGCRECHQ